MEIVQQSWVRIAAVVALIGAGFAIRVALVYFASRLKSVQKAVPEWLSLQRKFAGPLDFFICAVLIHIVVPLLDFSVPHEKALTHIGTIVLTISATWFLLQLLDVIEKVIQVRLVTTSTDDLRQRRMRTQVQFMYRVSLVVVLIVGLAAVLMSFDGARRIGASMIASAGVASIVIGFAAQKSLSNLIAGFQIAFTQPIRISDVVVVEGEWGTIEEISLTYVVIKIWDLRRLVLPITYFVEKPFQNWTRTSANILGYFYLYVDYRVPVAKLREELSRLVELTPLWDRQCCILQVTNISEKAVELRGLVSARTASDAFDLRCLLREGMLEYVSQHFPDHFPLQRASMTLSPGSVPSSAADLAGLQPQLQS